MHVIVGEPGVLLDLDPERLQSAERGIGVVVERLKQLVLPLRQAQERITAIEEERSSHARKIGMRVILTIDYTCLLHEPIVRHPHPSNRLTSSPADPRRLFKYHNLRAQFM